MMRILFMGTPDFAVPSLLALIEAGYEVVGAVTQPDKPRGRGNKHSPCPVKVLAQAHHIPVLQFPRLRGAEGVAALKSLAPDLFVTAAYGQILSQEILHIPPMGTVNVHASLLPAYRGPAPINWCLMEGETITGVTTMLTDRGVDTGDMLLSREIAIAPDETAETLSQRLAKVGAALLIETVQGLVDGSITPTPQDHDKATRHPMLTKTHGLIDWTRPATAIANQVRGVVPWPGAYTTLPGGGTLKIWAARPGEGSGRPGEILSMEKSLTVACGEGTLTITQLQAPGSKRMGAADYLRGHPMAMGLILGTEDR